MSETLKCFALSVTRVNSCFSITLQPELLSFKQKKDYFRYFPWSMIMRATLCPVYPVYQAQVSEPLKGSLKWTTRKHRTHPSLLQILCTTASGTAEEFASKLPSHSIRLGRAEHGPAGYDLCNPGAHPAGSQGVLFCAASPSVGRTSLSSSPHVSAWAPPPHSFSTVNMKQMPAFNSSVHFFGMLVSVLFPLQCFYEGLPGYFERCILCV